MPSAADAVPYVFLSYASADRERALTVADALEESGVPVWLDRRSIAGGTSWDTEIVHGIAGCAALLLCATAAAVASRNVQRELRLAVESGRPVLPLRLEPVSFPPEVRYALAGVQWIDVLQRTRPEWLAEVLHALTRLGLAPERGREAAPTGIPYAPASAPSPRTAPATNLPASLTSFVGRTQELADVAARLTTDHLVTLTGPGGAGKTRLAIEAARTLVDTYHDGVWLVELAPLADPALVPGAVAAAIAVTAEPNRSVADTLVTALHAKTVLLLLDNCEHLIEASAALAEVLLRACPALRILATSREPLAIGGETLYRVPPLSLPDASLTGEALVAALPQSDAVRLFVERAQAAQSHFAVTVANAPAVAEVCRRLDGIPLALELAAARLRALSVEQIAQRLADRFRLLTGGSRTALPRQQTLRAAIDWSHELLPEPERIVFRRLAVFAGGWTLAAAETVCAGEGIAEPDVLDALAELVDKSLVSSEEHDDQRRYTMLETVREYALERLGTVGEEARARGRHAAQVAAFAEVQGFGLLSPTLLPSLQRLRAERDNVRAALRWAIAHGDAEVGLRITGALGWFWCFDGWVVEGHRFTEQVLTLPGRASTDLTRAKALVTAAAMAGMHGDDEASHRYAAESLALCRTLDDRRSFAYTAAWIGPMVHGDDQLAREVGEEAVALMREAADPWGLGLALANLGQIAQGEGRLREARALFEESLTVLRPFGSTWLLAVPLVNLGLLAFEEGDLTQARALIEESLPMLRAVGNHPNLAGALGSLALVLLQQGETERAGVTAREALAISRAMSPRSSALYLNLVAGAISQAGDATRGARLFGAAAAAGEIWGMPLHGILQSIYDRTIAAVRTALGDHAFATAWAEGRALSLDAALALALEERS